MRLFSVLLLTCLSFATFAQQSKRLNEGWQFLRQDLGGIWEAIRPVPKGAPESVPLWDSVSLPHCVNAIDAVDPDVNYYQGPAWYRTTIDVKNPYIKGRSVLHFEGAGQKTDVFVYTTKVGSHVGGYDEWKVDITDAIEMFKRDTAELKRFKGKIPIAIRTDNSRDLEMIPSNLSDFNLYGGIYRYLNLEYQPQVIFDKVFVSPGFDESGKGTIAIDLTFQNTGNTSKGKILAEILGPDGKVVVRLEDQLIEINKWKKEIEIKKAERWSVDKPLLYQLRMTVEFPEGKVTHAEKFGFRNFRFEERGPFYLNEERVLLRGTHRHEDHAGVGAAMTEEMIRKEMIMMKEMGVNFIRLGHYQQSRIVLDLCDSLGILVWEEIPWCRGGLGGEIYKSQAKRMLINMIEQHFNHPSIIIWGLGNENDWPGDFPEFDKEKIRVFMKELNDLAHARDSTRKTAIRRCGFCRDIVDVYSPSIWAGWYRGAYTDYKSVSETERDRVKHFLHVEWGGDSHAGRHAENPDAVLGEIVSGKGADERLGDASLFGGSARVSKDGDWSESYICNLIDWHLKEQETMPWLSGTAYWPFKDFSTPVRPDNPVPYVNQKGVVERDFTKKEAYYVFQSWWTSKPMAHIYGHTWPVRWGKPGESKMIKVYSNCDQAELFVNGRSLGKKNRNAQDFPAAGLRWMVPLNAGKNSVNVVATRGKEQVEDSISFVYQTASWKKPARVSFQKISEDDDVVTLEAKVLDEENVQCLDARDFIRFDIVGNGELIVNQGTSSGSQYVQLYNGRAIVRMKKSSGRSIVTAKSGELPVAFLEIN